VARGLSDRGYRSVYALKGGFDAWEAAGYPTESKKESAAQSGSI
jgi:rhodanese-related sulfurtransferase